MGRKGSKRRGRREDRATTVAENHPAKQMKLVPDGRNASKRAGSEGGGGNNLRAMPWTRWTGSELHNAKAEHLALADWKRDSFTSAAFEAYYRRQLSSHNPRGLLPEAEWPDFLAALRRPLPATFRLNPRHPAGAALLRRLRAGEFDLPAANGPQGRALRSWRWRGLPLPGYLVTECHGVPGGCAWQLGVDRAGFRAVRKLPLGEALYTALAAAAEEGGAGRQEVVSMLPALLLGPQPGDRVADLCASPGSKTGQLLEAVRPFDLPQREEQQEGLSDDDDEEEQGDVSPHSLVRAARAGSGMVVANDLDRADRIPALVQRLSCRPKHERAGLVVCCLPGEALPNPCFPSTSLPSGSRNRGYDCVLVDAPCSGDGTIRKAADVLRRWSPEPGLKLHTVQLSLLRHALEITREGGRVVYSTCTFNPIENEAVVAAALSSLPGGPGSDCVLLDAHAEMARLHREAGGHGEEGTTARLVLRSGLRSWAVANLPAGTEALQWHKSAKDAKSAGMDNVAATMWPPTSCELNLERCARVLPQDNDTGGFFIALIHKGPASSKISTPNAPSQAVVASDLVPMSSLSKAHAKAVLAKHCLPPEKNVRRGLTSSERGRLWCSGGNGEAGGSEALVMVAPQDMLEHDECLGRRSWRGVVQAGLPLAEAVLLQQSSKGL